MQILTNSSYDQREINLALRLIQKRRKYFKDGVVTLDCGANIGVHTIEWAKNMTGWGEVFSFEAQEQIYYALAGNVAINNCFNVTARNVALGSEIGKIEVPQPNYHQAGSFGSLEIIQKKSNEFIGQNIDYNNTKLIDMVTIDSLNLKRIDLIKVDVEGMEEEALNGSIKSIKSDIKFLKKFLEKRDYEIFVLGMNILAINKKDETLNDITTTDGVFKIN